MTHYYHLLAKTWKIMSPTLNGGTLLQRFERGNVVEIRNGIMFDFYPGLPQICISVVTRLVSLYWRVWTCRTVLHRCHPILSLSSHCYTISKLSCHVFPAVWYTLFSCLDLQLPPAFIHPCSLSLLAPFWLLFLPTIAVCTQGWNLQAGIIYFM